MKGVRLLFSAVLAALACQTFASPVKVSDCVRCRTLDVWAEHDVEFCHRVMDAVFKSVGLETEHQPFADDGLFNPSLVEVVCSAFRTPGLLEKYDFPLQPIGRMRFSLYTTPERAELMMSMKITDWPSLRVGYSPVSQGRDDDRERYFKNAALSPEYVEYKTSESAVKAIYDGEIDVIFLYTPLGKSPEGLIEIVPIGERNVYFAVRKDRPDLMDKLTSAYRNWYIDHIDEYDEWRSELLGIPKPENRVRVAAFSRGDIFSISPDGVRSGAGEAWLRAISARTHWDLDYVYGGYAESLEDVKKGRLDLIGGLGFSSERTAELSYPHTPIGMIRIYLWARPESPYQAGNPESWRGMRVGLVSDTISVRHVKELVEGRLYDLSTREYDSDRELLDAYFSGEVDACVNVEMPELASERALRIYASHPMYFCCSKARPDLFDELESALESVCDDFPRYMRMISERHYGAHTEMSELTIKEAEWLSRRKKDATPIVIDFSPWPFALAGADGRPEGFPAEFISELEKKTALHFVLAPQAGIQTSTARFLRGDTQLWVPYPSRADAAALGAVSVFSMQVPRSCSEFYGVKDFRTEFEMLAGRSVPDELISILRKTVSGLDSVRYEEMFLSAVAKRKTDMSVFGLTNEEFREYAFIGIGILLCTIIVFGAIMITQLKRHARRADEAAHAALESAQAKTRFLAMMSHELRTPLNAVIGFAEFLERDSSDPERRRDYITGILTSAHALLDLINDILDFSKLEAGAMKMREGVCYVDEIAQEILTIFGSRLQTRGIKFSVRNTGPEKVPPLRLSRQGLRQILLNVIGNSAKFTERGCISIEYSWRREGGLLRLVLSDTGRGISSEKMKRLFDPFVQDLASRMKSGGGDESKKGTGLGLPIVKRLVDGAGGTISVKSSPGMGTRFEIEIPGLEPADATARIPTHMDPEDGRKAGAPQRFSKVMIVDDMQMNRKILGIHISNLGVKDIRFAEDGAKALEAMKDWVPDMVLTDMWMPGMDGAQLAAALRKDRRFGAVPIVAVTADVDVGSSYNMDVFDKVLAKPVTGDKIKALLKEL